VEEEELRESFRAVDDGRPFWEHAEEAGYEPARWRESIQVLDDLFGWIEPHIEQARVLQDTGNRLDIVNAIAGYVHADIVVHGRSDHAGATPMDFRQDAGLVAAECMLKLERLSCEAEGDTVGTVELKPGLINVVPGEARFSLDIRGVDEEAFRSVAHDIAAFAERAAGDRGMTTEYRQRQALTPAPLDEQVTGALETAAEATSEPYMMMPLGRGSRHDEHNGSGPQRDGLRALQGRHQSLAGGRRQPGRCSPGSGDHAKRHQVPLNKQLERDYS
jgi:allantoate deiminase